MRPEKASIIDYVQEKLGASPFLLVVEYTGMKVPHFAELRKRLAESGAECHVVKNTMLRRAAETLDWPEIKDCLGGQVAMITGPSDICAAAKVVKSFKAEFERPEIKGGILDRAVLQVEQILALADLPSKPVLQATLLGLLQAPASKLVRLLNEPAASLARVLQAKVDASTAG